MKRAFLVLFVCLSALWMVACAGQPGTAPTAQATPETVVVPVTVTVQVPGGTVTEVITSVVTATPAPIDTSVTSKNPDTYIITTFGDPETFDPALNYESAGAGIIQQVYETLITYDGDDATTFVPQLAAEMPTISEDGLTYSFTIRDGITFHNGNELTAEDVAYTFQRNLLQGGLASPQLLLAEPILGVGIYDVTDVLFAEDPEAGDKIGDPVAVQASDAADLLALCELVQSKIVADGNTVTFNLENPWAPFISTLAGGWGSVMDKEWTVENGAWDGDCATWQNFYGIASENDPLTTIANGTGPYVLERWTPGEEIVLVANENYWRTEEVGPAWEGGPVGTPAIPTVSIQNVTEWGTRFATMQAGDSDQTVVNPENWPQMDQLVGEICEYDAATLGFTCGASETPTAPFRLYRGAPNVSRTDMIFTWNINVEGGNPLVGSGALDGNGIPSDFFSDINVRRGFAYCFDWDTYINDVLQGEAVQNVGVVLPGMLGYNEEGSKYTFDPDLCAEELATAWGGTLPETGFRFQFAYNTGNTTRQIIGEILQANLDAVSASNPTAGNYVVETIGLPWANFLRNQREARLPIFTAGWNEDIHDPHNWVQPFLVGTYANRAGFPAELVGEFSELINAAVVSTDDAERQALYEQISELDYENVTGVRLAVPTVRRYEQRWVKGWYYNPAYSATYYYSLSEE